MVPKKTSKETDAILIDNVGQKLIDKCVLFFLFLLLSGKSVCARAMSGKTIFFADAIGY